MGIKGKAFCFLSIMNSGYSGIHPVWRSPILPQYYRVSVRQKKFVDHDLWRNTSICYDLALAGFIPCGASNYMICFCCLGAIQNLKEDEDPWILHAKFYPECNYVQSRKGREFVETVLMNHTADDEERRRKSIECKTQRDRLFPRKKEAPPSSILSSNSCRCYCSICLTNEKSILIYPCLHLACCEGCKPFLRDRRYCIICRGRVRKMVKVYLS